MCGRNIKVFPQESEILQCWYYWEKGFKKCAIEMDSGGQICFVSCLAIGAVRNITVITTTDWEASKLVLLIVGICVVCRSQSIFIKFLYECWKNIKARYQQFQWLYVAVTYGEELMKCTVKIDPVIQNLMVGHTHTHTDKHKRGVISHFIFST
jgi:hypothetical protein